MCKRFNPLKPVIAVLLFLTLIIPVIPATTAHAIAPALGENVIPNPGFEDGNANGWTYDEGSFSLQSYTGSHEFYGYYYAQLADGHQISRIISNIIGSEYYYIVDSGAMKLNISFDSSQANPDGLFYVNYLSSGDVNLGSCPVADVVSSMGFSRTSGYNLTVPAYTRKIEVVVSNPVINTPSPMDFDNLTVSFHPQVPYVTNEALYYPGALSSPGFSIFFNEDIHKSELMSSSDPFFAIYQDDTLIADIPKSDVSVASNGAYFVCPVTLSDFTTYKLKMYGGVFHNSVNNDSCAFDYRGNWCVFTTGDTTPPGVLALNPSNGSHYIMNDGTYSIDYNEIVHAVSGNITISGPGGPWVIDVTDTTQIVIDDSSGLSEVQIHPTAPLTVDSLYSINIPAGAFADASGNSTPSLSWSFYTDRYLIQFDPQGGTPDPSDQHLYARDTVTRPSDPINTGYLLEGWYTDTDFAPEHLYDFTAEVMSSFTLYAHWIPADTTPPNIYDRMPALDERFTIPDANIFITFDEDVTGVSGKYVHITQVGGSTVDIEATASNVSITGAEVIIDPDTDFVKNNDYYITLDSGAFTDLAGNPCAAIGAEEWKFDTNQCKVTFDKLDGTTPNVVLVDCKETVTKPSPDPTRPHYTFGGWFISTDFLPEHQWDFSTQVTDDMTLFAKWIGARVKVASSDTRQGTVSGGGYYPIGSTAVVTATPKSGCYFRRWVISRTVVSTDWKYSFTVTGPATLRADFARIGTPSLRSAVSTGYNSIDLTWREAAGATGYLLYQRIGRTGTWTQIADLPAGTLAYTDTSLTLGQSYYYKVRAYCVTGGLTTYGSYSTSKYAIPGTKVTVSSSSTRLGTVTGGGYYSLGSTATVTATPKSGCYFRRWVASRAVVSTSYEYSFTVTRAVTVRADFARIGTPNLRSAASAGYNSIALTWREAAGATGYNVYQREGRTGSWTPIVDLPAGTTTYKVPSLTCGHRYYYKVKAYCLTGSLYTFGSYSHSKYATPIPAKPSSIIAASSSPVKAKISWSAVDGASKYQVFRSTSRTGTYRLQGETLADTLSFYQEGLTTGRTYYYKVRAVYIDSVTLIPVYGTFSAYASVRPE